MKRNRQTIGFTILEMLVVVAVIVILTSMVITLASRFEDRGNERVIKSTFAMLDAALGEFADYGYEYKDPNYDELRFPLDCNGFGREDFEDEVEAALGLDSGDIEIYGVYHEDYSGSAGLYFFLSQVPECRKVLDRIDVSLVTNEDDNGDKLQINVDGQRYPFNRIIDPWGETIRYSYYRNKEAETLPTSEPEMDDARTFPLLTSSGPDGEFNTPDDIKSNE
jgi:type II secretory pathway pseudopilin PulG